jgi:hydroxymethylbilane synthase
LLGRYRLRRIILTSRKSTLARLQSYCVAQALKNKHKDITIDFFFKESLGDKDLTSPLWKMPERGVFTKDFREDLLNETVDIVVHSYKDVELEQDGSTVLLSVLQRADQRDILLLKKTALLSTNFSTLQILSSSPRREYNLKKFFSKALPKRLQNKEIEFQPVRGNVQTRLNKWKESGSQGIILAKAALDRLLSEDFPEASLPEFASIRETIRTHLAESCFMVLPLSENPNAPAQGAFAVEVKSSRKDILGLVQTISVPETESSVSQERTELKKYGGGCHQKIGVSVSLQSYGEIWSIRGLTDSGKVLQEYKLLSHKTQEPVSDHTRLYPNEGERLVFQRTIDSSVELPNTDVWVARYSAWNPSWKQTNWENIVWTAGLKTWYALANSDVWVHGSAEGLGEETEHGLDKLIGRELNFMKLTHSESDHVHSSIQRLCTYQLSLEGEIPDVSNKEYFFWMSGYQFDLVVSKYPQIVERYHACGPGITYQHISKQVKHPVDIFLSYTDWLNYHYQKVTA